MSEEVSESEEETQEEEEEQEDSQGTLEIPPSPKKKTHKKKCLWSADARRDPPVKGVQNALLPSSNCVEISPR